jgi:hypothetical protein
MRHFCQCLFAQLFTNFGERLALRVSQVHTPCDLVAQDAIFGDQIGIAEQEFLID